MAEIKAFRPLRYTEKAGDIASCVCPPYDIVNEEMRKELCARSECNLIRLELPEGENKYKEAKKLLDSFIEKGYLKKDEKDGIFIYEEEFTLKGKTLVLDGLVCLCKTYDFSEGVVLPHEETLSKAKKDRFDLMTETFCNFSSVYSLFTDDEGYIQSVIDAKKEEAPLVCFTSDDGIIQRMWKIDDEKAISGIVDFFAPKQLFIADGHHRYETAGAFNKYCIENGIDADSGYIMMTLVDMDSPGLAVLPAHRIVTNMDVDAADIIEKAKEDFIVGWYDDITKMEQVLESVSDRNAVAMYSGGGGFWLLILDEARMVGRTAVGGLDVSVLHDLILEKLLGIDKENMKNQKNLVYTRDASEAISRVDDGASPVSFILNATKVSQIKSVALEGSKMPQKSTYFYPKLITGLLINQFKETNI